MVDVKQIKMANILGFLVKCTAQSIKATHRVALIDITVREE